MDEKLYERAKEVSLHGFLAMINGKDGRRGSNGWVRYQCCPDCGRSKHADDRIVAREGWRCHACGQSGDVIDAASMFWKCSKYEAAKRLLGDVVIVAPSWRYDPEKQKQEDVDRKKTLAIALKKLAAHLADKPIDPVCLAYLHEERKLPEELLEEAHRRGILATLPGNPYEAFKLLKDVIGESLLKQSGLWREGSKMPAICFRPIVFFSNTVAAAEFRLASKPKGDEPKGIRYGDGGWWIWEGKDPSRSAIVEGCIDMLSMVALGFSGSVYALPGCNAWPNWSQDQFDLLPENCCICLDNDASAKNPGQHWALKLMEHLVQMGRKVQNRVPPPGKDVNEVYRSRFV